MVDRPAAGTLDDLLADACELGLPASERLLRDWHRLGLLASPQRRSLGQGHGQAPALYSPQQRALFQAVVRNRVTNARNAALARIPVWAWLYHGDEWVTLDQLWRALHTAVGNPRQARRVAGQLAKALLDQIDLHHAPYQARAALRHEVTNQLYRGHSDAARLRHVVAAVFQPFGLHLVRGPAGAPLTVDSIVVGLDARMRAARALNALTDEQLLTAWQRHQASWQDYQQRRPQFAADAGEQLAALFSEPSLTAQVETSVRVLLLLIGLQLQPAQPATPGR